MAEGPAATTQEPRRGLEPDRRRRPAAAATSGTTSPPGQSRSECARRTRDSARRQARVRARRRGRWRRTVHVKDETSLQELLQLLPREEEPRLDGTGGQLQQLRHFSDIVAFHRGQDDDDAELLGERVDGAPELVGSRARLDDVWRRRRRGAPGRLLARGTPAGGALPIDRQPPRHPDEPGAKAVAIAELAEAAMRTHEGFLGHVLGVLPMSQHAVGDPERQRGRLDKPGLELPFELVVRAYQPADESVRVFMHHRGRRRGGAPLRPPGPIMKQDATVRPAVHYRVSASFSGESTTETTEKTGKYPRDLCVPVQKMRLEDVNHRGH